MATNSIEGNDGSILQTSSTDQYHNYLNNVTGNHESSQENDENFASRSIIAPKQGYEFEQLNPRKVEMRSSSISSSKISLISETTSSNELIGWSYQCTRDGKLCNMSKDFEWQQLYRSRYVNERVEHELAEFKDEIEKKFNKAKSKNYAFPRKNSKAKKKPEKQEKQEKSKEPILLSQNFIIKTNIEKKERKEKKQDMDMSLIQTFDEENKHQLSKSLPRTSTNSKTRKSKHKRQATLFKFAKSDGNNRAKVMLKTNSNCSVDSQPMSLEQLTQKVKIVKKNTDIQRYKALDQRQSKIPKLIHFWIWL